MIVSVALSDSTQAKRKLTETIEFLESRVADSALIARQQWETLSEVSTRLEWPEEVRYETPHDYTNAVDEDARIIG